ncbi:hypothetical protein FHS57_005450 [Runella defluvii]|uniref:Uncharacterized protein n=1 Tax=Runella defluvii TaxID=370973 RepID=A0A7W5ZTS4_9BACT|nr:hypothetical protein [Runella defluvii]MBB3841422.1 hypothetical protein [Runella defluvii]
MNGKRVIAYFLLTLISFKMLASPFVYLDFELRKEFIIKNLCENRFKPQLHCDGKCYLAKQLHKVAEDNAANEAQKQGENIKKVLEEVFEDSTGQQTSPFSPKRITFSVCVFKPNFYISDFSLVLLQPPAFTA